MSAVPLASIAPPPPAAQILCALDKEERKLFHDRIRALDRRIMPGVSKLAWTSERHALDFYHREARKHCREADQCVTGVRGVGSTRLCKIRLIRSLVTCCSVCYSPTALQPYSAVLKPVESLP